MKSLLENIDLMTYKINFNYQKKAVYHSIFGVFISICIYAFLVVLIQYFDKDFVNKTNPRIIYQETEFTDNDNFTIPIKFIIKYYYYIFEQETNENLFNLTSNEDSKDFTNQTNNFFQLGILFYYDNYLMTLEMIDRINIKSIKLKDENGKQIFKNSFYKNINENFFNLKILNYSYETGNWDIIHTENRLSYDNFNISILPESEINLRVKNNEIIKNLSLTYFEISNMDNIINVNNPTFFKNYSSSN